MTTAERVLRSFRTFCVLCTRPIPRKRQRRRAVTCSERHQKKLTKLRKMERDHRQCSHCGKPVTPDEIAEFRLWKASMTHGSASRKPIRAKGIRGPAVGIVDMSEHAYVCPEKPRGRKRQQQVKRKDTIHK